jgi:hypothetical protein
MIYPTEATADGSVDRLFEATVLRKFAGFQEF